MAGTSSTHKAKVRKARRMLTREERLSGTPVFQGGQWRFRALMNRVRTNAIARENWENRKNLFKKMFKKAEKINGKKESKTA